MWLTERLGIAGSAYRMPLPIVFDGPLDRAAMLRACEAVVARHPILGCAFEEIDGMLYLLPGVGGHFDYSLVELGPQRHLLRFEAHHLVFDGTSKDILLRDLAKAYAGQPLEPLGFSQPEPGDVGLAKTTGQRDGVSRRRSCCRGFRDTCARRRSASVSISSWRTSSSTCFSLRCKHS